MHEQDVNRTELARRAGVSKSNITQLLSGDHNMRLTTVADLLYALDSKLTVSPVPLDVDSIVQSITSFEWAAAVDLPRPQFEYRAIGNEGQEGQLFQAA
jgi:transcriptional regulator with XRE-family HTH domain